MYVYVLSFTDCFRGRAIHVQLNYAFTKWCSLHVRLAQQQCQPRLRGKHRSRNGTSRVIPKYRWAPNKFLIVVVYANICEYLDERLRKKTIPIQFILNELKVCTWSKTVLRQQATWMSNELFTHIFYSRSFLLRRAQRTRKLSRKTKRDNFYFSF